MKRILFLKFQPTQEIFDWYKTQGSNSNCQVSRMCRFGNILMTTLLILFSNTATSQIKVGLSGRISHWIIFPYLSGRLKRSRTFFIISPRVLKFCMKPPTHILNKIGVRQNLCKKVKYFSILNFVWKMLKNGKFWLKNGIPAFLAHKWW